MKYETQRLALLYFWGAMILFLAQVTFGVLAGSIYVLPNLLSETLPFNILRMIHTNALLVWRPAAAPARARYRSCPVRSRGSAACYSGRRHRTKRLAHFAGEELRGGCRARRGRRVDLHSPSDARADGPPILC
jgi:hypothetical protein